MEMQRSRWYVLPGVADRGEAMRGNLEYYSNGVVMRGPATGDGRNSASLTLLKDEYGAIMVTLKAVFTYCLKRLELVADPPFPR